VILISYITLINRLRLCDQAMSSLDELDKPSATLRILLMLSKNEQGINITRLHESMSGGYGVGRIAVDTSRRALVSMELAEEQEMRGRGANFKVLSITLLGQQVAEKIKEIADLIDKK
jgi:hypothetical protein